MRRRGGASYFRALFSDPSPSPPVLQDPHWVNRESLFLKLPPLASRPIVFLGDSLTEFGEWNELFGGKGLIINRGISADTTSGVLSRLDAVIAMHPRAVFLMIGTNDLLLGLKPEETAQNYKLIMGRLRMASPAPVVYAQSILPVAESIKQRSNKRIMDVNEQIKSAAAGKGVVYVDLYKDFVSGFSLNPKLSSDGLHLNGEGYALVAAWLRSSDFILPN
jgi:lysophospholipase L1-like esterase